MARTYDLGSVTSYAIAVEHGYTGTEAQFAAELTGATAAARAAAQDASDAEAYAIGTRDGTAVASTDAAYHNNSKYWAEQGVLLLNTVLTVRAHAANSHRGHGWEIFTDKIIRLLNDHERPLAFILWGRPARSKKAMITNTRHFIVESAHPSPLSADRGFFGSRPFSRVNEFLKSVGETPIDWQIPNLKKGAF